MGGEAIAGDYGVALARLEAEQRMALKSVAAGLRRHPYAGLMRGQRVVVPGFGNKAVTLLTRLLPRRIFTMI